MGSQMDVRAASCKVFVPHFPFVYNVECSCNSLRRYIYVAIGAQRGSRDPKNLLSDDPSDVLGLKLFPELDHGGCDPRYAPTVESRFRRTNRTDEKSGSDLRS